MAATRSVTITYVPSDCGSIIPGKSKAPKAFQDVDLTKKLHSSGIASITEHHALDSPATWTATTHQPGSVRNESLNISVCNDVHHTISQNLNGTPIPPFQLILGGECSMLPAILTAYWEHATAHTPSRRVGLIYIDADTDLTSPTDPASTGTFASMTMTHLLSTPGALSSMSRFSRPDGQPLCNVSNTVFFGTNIANPSNRPEHLAYLFDQGHRVISSTAVAKDPEGEAAKALAFLEDQADVIIVHLDVDSIDPGEFPLANVPNFTGVRFEVMMRAVRVLVASAKVGALVVAEVNPDHDPGLEMVGRLTDEMVGMLAARSG